MRLRVTQVIEKDEDRVLVRGETPAGEVRTFHLVRDEAGVIDKLVGLVEDGRHVEVDW